MRAYHFEEHVDRSPHVVWTALLDLPAAPRWRPLVVTMETEDGQPVQLGSRIRLTIDFMGERSTRVSETVAFEPDRLWTLRSSSNPSMEGVFEFRLIPEGTGTRIVATCDLHAHAVLPWLFLPLIARGERRRREEMLGNLKRFVESSAG
jgi:uncharacterized protein YndB with AHSA1/START domain